MPDITTIGESAAALLREHGFGDDDQQERFAAQLIDNIIRGRLGYLMTQEEES